jgi:hypothetical protein
MVIQRHVKAVEEGDAEIEVIRAFEDIDEKSNAIEANSTTTRVSMLKLMDTVCAKVAKQWKKARTSVANTRCTS